MYGDQYSDMDLIRMCNMWPSTDINLCELCKELASRLDERNQDCKELQEELAEIDRLVVGK